MLLPFDSTIKANISVGPPIDFQIYEADSFHTGPNGRFHKDDPYLLEISNGWGRACLLYTSPSPRDQRGSG